MQTIERTELPRLADLHPASAFVPAFRPAHRAPAGRPRQSLWQRVLAWHRVARERRRLLELDERILKDIGLTPEQARSEAMRPFWDQTPLR